MKSNLLGNYKLNNIINNIIPITLVIGNFIILIPFLRLTIIAHIGINCWKLK